MSADGRALVVRPQKTEDRIAGMGLERIAILVAQAWHLFDLASSDVGSDDDYSEQAFNDFAELIGPVVQAVMKISPTSFSFQAIGETERLVYELANPRDLVE